MSMGFSNIFSPKTLLYNTLCFFGLIKQVIYTLILYPSLPDLYDPEVSWWPPPRIQNDVPSVSAALLRELLPVVKFSELVDSPVSCAVCLYQFDGDDHIRRLIDCKHIFHQNCVDRWMDYDHETCPLCRTPFIAQDLL